MIRTCGQGDAFIHESSMDESCELSVCSSSKKPRKEGGLGLSIHNEQNFVSLFSNSRHILLDNSFP